jgi:hypothetical protein
MLIGASVQKCFHLKSSVSWCETLDICKGFADIRAQRVPLDPWKLSQGNMRIVLDLFQLG